MNHLLTTPTLIVISIITYIFASILITRYIINGGKNEKDIILQNKLKAKKAKSFQNKYPEANVQTIRNFALAFGFIFAFAGSIFAFSILGERQTPMDLGKTIIDPTTVIDILPPINNKKQLVQPKEVPPPPPIKKDPNPTIITKKKIVKEPVKTIEPTDIDKPEIIDNGGDKEIDEPIVTVFIAEKMPKFVGCENMDEEEAYNCTMTKIQQYIATIEYPGYAFDNEIEGKVYVSFIINSKGEVTEVELARKADKSLNNASLKHLKKMPKFASGGSQGGKNVNVKFNVPIVFKLSH